MYFQTLQSAAPLAGSIGNGAGLAAFGAVLWTGWVTCAYTIYAQSFGQRFVGPTDANLIYSTQPVFLALFAYALLHKSLGVQGYIGGGGMIGAALYLIASDGSGGGGVGKGVEG